MRLRDKKTGEIREGRVEVIFQNNDKFPNPLERHVVESFAELNADWEEIKEPIIKDEKVRKLVREWAEINGIETVLVCQTFNAWGFKNKESGKAGDKEYMLADILFKGEKPEELEFGKEYAIPELCGEEEE